MRIKALHKALKFYDMINVFNITPTETITILEGKLHDLFIWNDVLDQYVYDIHNKPENPILLANRTAVSILSKKALEDIDDVNITPINLVKNFKEVDVSSICQINTYCVKYGNTYSVKNIAWSGDRILGTFNDVLRDKSREGLIGVSEPEAGGPLVFNMILDIVTDFEDSALRSLMQSLQHLRLVDVPGKHVGTVVSYLKGSLMMLQNCDEVPTDTLGLLNKVVCSADCGEFSEYMKSMYYVSRQNRTPGAYM